MNQKKTERQWNIPPTHVLWVAESNFATGNGIKPHKHNYYHLFMVRNGTANVMIDNTHYTLTSGESFLSTPNTLHSLSEVTQAMLSCYEIKFTANAARLKCILESLPYKLPADPFVFALVKEIVDEGGRGGPLSPSLTSDYLLTLINYFQRHYSNMVQEEVSIVDTTGYSDLSRHIVRYLENNYHREIPLQELADEVGFNKNYICSAFKRDTDMTIGNCTTAIRIRKAAELISFSDMNLSQVAEATGFINQSHFNRIFKKVVGIPPGQYRRMFTADILISPDAAQIDDETIQNILEQNGFIASVLGHKRISILNILENLQEDIAQE